MLYFVLYDLFFIFSFLSSIIWVRVQRKWISSADLGNNNNDEFHFFFLIPSYFLVFFFSSLLTPSLLFSSPLLNRFTPPSNPPLPTSKPLKQLKILVLICLCIEHSNLHVQRQKNSSCLNPSASTNPITVSTPFREVDWTILAR